MRKLRAITLAVVILTCLAAFGYELYLEHSRPMSPDAHNAFVVRAWPANGSVYLTKQEYEGRNLLFIASAMLAGCAIALNGAASRRG